MTPRLALCLALLVSTLDGAAAPAWAESAVEAEAAPASADAGAAPETPDPEAAQKALCLLIETAASDHALPVGFFTRLIWKESRFRADAVSPKGAQGIAQFMPTTAAARGLEDPFDIATAIPASASYLADLKARFGNLGLAAAAYNAGESRVDSWLADTSSLPYETQDFVLTITGLPAETWADPEAEKSPAEAPPAADDCLALAKLLRGPGAPLAPSIETARAPWGVQVAGNFSRARAIATYSALGKRYPSLIGGKAPMIVSGRAAGRGKRAFYRVRVPVDTRADGEKLCAALRKAGGDCVVLKT